VVLGDDSHADWQLGWDFRDDAVPVPQRRGKVKRKRRARPQMSSLPEVWEVCQCHIADPLMPCLLPITAYKPQGANCPSNSTLHTCTSPHHPVHQPFTITCQRSVVKSPTLLFSAHFMSRTSANTSLWSWAAEVSAFHFRYLRPLPLRSPPCSRTDAFF
jgi:hypothetical protein